MKNLFLHFQSASATACALICGWASQTISSFSPERWRAPIRISFANTAETISNLLGVANDFDSAVAEEWIRITPPLGDYPHSKGMQRVDAKAVQAMANHFSSLRAKLSRRFGGLPFFVGHPDVAGLANEYPDQKAYGWIMEVEAREDGLYGKTKWSEPGKQMLANAHYKFFSPHWNAEQVTEGGKRVLRPVELVSVGLTNKPNLPVNPLANEAEQNNDMKLLATLVALLGLANEAGEEQVIKTVTDLKGAAAAAENNSTALANEKTEHGKTKTTLETQLANAQSDLKAERKARIELMLANAIAAGKITEAQKAQWLADLESDFAGKSEALANAKPAVKTESKTGAMGNRRTTIDVANVAARREQVLGLVNAKMKGGLDYDAAFAAVKQENPALFEAMAKPEQAS